MRRRLLGAAGALALLACAMGFPSASAAEAGQEPLMPSLAQISVAQLEPSPVDSDVTVPGAVTLSWTRVAPADLVRYDVHFGTDSPPPRVAQNQIECEWKIEEPLAPGEYYWRVVARTATGEEAAGPLCCFWVPHWLQASVEGTDIDWIIQHPGRFAAPISDIAVRSNDFVWMRAEATENLESAQGKEIETWYSVGEDVVEADEWGWTPAETMHRRHVEIQPLLTCDGWAIQHLKLWQELDVTKCTPRGEYANSVVITFCSEP